MRWTDMDEKEMIKAWAAEEYSEEIQREYLPQPDVCRESYWADYDNGGNLMEYDFSSISELLVLLEAELPEKKMEELFKPIAVATFKQRARESVDGRILTEAGEEVGKMEIPEFVYIF